MELSQASLLLDPAPLQLETGFERLPNGVLHVACRTDLHNCTGEMFEWWFRSRPGTREYIWWHPVDHVSSDWAEGSADTHVGSIHLVKEYFTGMPAADLAIQFRDAAEFFGAEAYRAARDSGAISAAVCGRVGMGATPQRLPTGEVLGGRLLHIGRDTKWGLALRSHFYMGQDLVADGWTPDQLKAEFSDDFGRALLMHCYNEFTFLSRFLPGLHAGDNRDTKPVTLPW
ncbi:hydrolase [Achromobacter sp. Marseille-Q0513]|uniref:DAPG hydrolase family protein n=1 Tax=Achromobacter sp. Marseille-Q0513 TaxID=2829161 RepID=UPI001B9181C3|nr:hydrolase [Achromobacter sp. Marseille-Q0513]MBR8657098.1 hydrolase [Achromobacter sp. Marseille-Q0513]